MPRIIRRALLEKFLALQEVATFLADFEELTGLELRLMDEFGNPVVPGREGNRLCAMIKQTPAGEQLCRRTRQKLLSRAEQNCSQCECDVGLVETAIPFEMGGARVGYFVFVGSAGGEIGGQQMKRLKHLLNKAGVTIDPEIHRELLRESPTLRGSSLQAVTRIVKSMADYLSLLASHDVLKEHKTLPPIAHKARRFIRSHATSESCGLKDVAQACGVSSAHLSRVFHQSTGITISEYTSRFRVEHAIGLLKGRHHSITDVAFASGFQTISQFNRTFKRVAGCAPSQVNLENWQGGGSLRPTRKAPKPETRHSHQSKA